MMPLRDSLLLGLVAWMIVGLIRCLNITSWVLALGLWIIGVLLAHAAGWSVPGQMAIMALVVGLPLGAWLEVKFM